MPKWEDSTSYSRDDKERIPRAWTLRVADLRITVTNGHIYHKGEWVLHCSPWFDTYPLNLPGASTAEEAQTKALDLVRARVKRLSDAMADVL